MMVVVIVMEEEEEVVDGYDDCSMASLTATACGRRLLPHVLVIKPFPLLLCPLL